MRVLQRGGVGFAHTLTDGSGQISIYNDSSGTTDLVVSSGYLS